jgi:hypothetical protein
MQDDRYYYETGASRGRRGYRKKPAYQAETALRDALRLRAMIAQIEHSIMALELSIEVEHERAGVDKLAYPISERDMEARLENLRITRAALVSRLSSAEPPVSLGTRA